MFNILLQSDTCLNYTQVGHTFAGENKSQSSQSPLVFSQRHIYKTCLSGDFSFTRSGSLNSPLPLTKTTMIFIFVEWMSTQDGWRAASLNCNNNQTSRGHPYMSESLCWENPISPSQAQHGGAEGRWKTLHNAAQRGTRWSHTLIQLHMMENCESPDVISETFFR